MWAPGSLPGIDVLELSSSYYSYEGKEYDSTDIFSARKTAIGDIQQVHSKCLKRNS